jgi:hypothetical protein
MALYLAAQENGLPVRRAAKVDGNHPEIVEGLRAMGLYVQSLAAVGDGCPDLLIGAGEHRNVLLEVKVPGKQLNAIQKVWHRDYTGTAHVVWSLADAIEVIRHYKNR